jgi:hypothetical protein
LDDFSIFGDSWRLVPLKRQHYQQKNTHKNFDQNITNWIVSERIRPNPDKVLKESVFEQDISKSRDNFSPLIETDIKEKLKILLELKKEGLINQEEYLKKRTELLKEF